MGNLVSNMMPAKGKGRPAITEGDAAALVSSAPERGTTGVAARNKQGRNNARSGAGGGGGNAPMAVASAANSSMQSVGDTSVERQSSEMNYDSNSSSMSDAMLNYEGQPKHPQHFSLDNVQFTENRRPVLAQHRTAPPTPRAKSPEFHPRAHSPMKHMQGNCCKHGHANRRFYDPSKMSFAQLKAVRTKQRLEFARNADRNRMMHMCHNHNHNHHQLQVQQQQPQQSQPPNQQQHNQLIRSASKYVMDQEPQLNAEAVGNKSSATPATVAPPQSTLKSVTARKQPASAATALQKANTKKSTIIKQTEFKPTKATTRSAAKVKAKKMLEACQEDLKEHVRVPAKKVKNCVSPRKSPRQMKKTSGVKAATTAAKQKGSKATTPRGTKEEVAKPESAAKVMENLYNSYSNTQQQQQQQQPALKQQKNPQQLQQQQYHPQLYKPPSYTDFSQYQAQLLRREHESDDLQNILNKQDASSSATDSFESSSSSSVPMSELLLRLDCKSRQKKEKAQARAAKKKAAKTAERMAAAKAAAEEAFKAQCEIENQEQIKQQQQERNKEGSMISSGDSSSTSISLTEILSKIEGGSIERGGDIDERQQTIRQNTKHDIDNDDYNQIPAKPSLGNASAKSTSIATESDIFDGDDEIIDVQDNASSTYGGD